MDGWPLNLGLGILHFSIGAIAANVAQRKGRRLSFWLPLGLVAGTPALIAALLLTPLNKCEDIT